MSSQPRVGIPTSGSLPQPSRGERVASGVYEIACGSCGQKYIGGNGQSCPYCANLSGNRMGDEMTKNLGEPDLIK